ncbi:hypothetical protein R1sor_002511 [Riccia sorocarpa]|uniref:FCP1 homology domain-containing protein n=1 Tax=Riccia sorocarpa TaxID=122646 RepID=A0ABD3H2Z3_9MARC
MAVGSRESKIAEQILSIRVFLVLGKWFNVILWTSRTERNLAVIVRACNKRGMFPRNFQREIKHSWSQTQCMSFQTAREHHKDGVLRCKSISVLYDHSICERDVLMLDDSVQKNSTNHPYQALHPHTFDPMKTAKKDDNYLNSVLLPVLDKFKFHRQDVMSFVEANWQTAQSQETFGKSAAYWGTIDARDETFIWSNYKTSDFEILKGE